MFNCSACSSLPTEKVYYIGKCSNVIISTPPLFIYCLVLHRLYSGGYYGVTAHTVFFPTCKGVLLVYPTERVGLYYKDMCSNAIVELVEFIDATNAGALMAQLTTTSDNKSF